MKKIEKSYINLNLYFFELFIISYKNIVFF
jgi:hypothetical protein